MKKIIGLIVVLFFFTSCISSKKTQEVGIVNDTSQEYISDVDRSYGYSEKNPIKVGGFKNGPIQEKEFLNSLTGPNGEKVKYYRIGSCCPFQTPNSDWGSGMLDKFSVTYNGLKKDLILYINMYDSDTLKAPIGFKFKK